MSNLKIFIKDFSTVSFGNILSRLFAAVISIVIARTFGPIYFGRFSILFSIMMIIVAGLSGIDFTYVHNSLNPHIKSKVGFSNYLYFKLFVSLILTVVGFLFASYISQNIFKQEVTFSGITITLFSAFFFITYTTVYTYYQASENFVKYSIIQVLYYFFVLLGTILFFKFNIKEYEFFLIPYLIVGLLIFSFFLIFHRDILTLNNRNLFSFVKIGKWIVFSEMFVVLFARLDLLILSHYISGPNLGFYSAAIRIVNIYLTFTAAFSAIMLPKASRVKNQVQKKKFLKASGLLSLFLVFFSFIIILMSKYIVLILYGSEYLDSYKIVRLLLIAYIPFTFYQPFRYLTYTHNKTFYLFLIPFIQCILFVLLSGNFIKWFSIPGVIYAKAVSFIIGGFFFFFVTYRERNF